MEAINFSVDNIMSEDEVASLLSNDNVGNNSTENDNNEGTEDNTNDENNIVTEGITFDDDLNFPESVGNEEEKHNQEDGENSTLQSSTSPQKNNFFSSIADALVNEGVFSSLEDVDINNIKDASDFSQFVNKQLESKLDEKQKRIDEALNNNVPVSDIQAYETTIKNLSNITEEQLSDESEQGELIRKNLIYQDYINRGFSSERAIKEVQKALDNGTDVDDAKESLQSCLDYYNNSYKELITKAKEEQTKILNKQKEATEKLKKVILEDKTLFGGLEIDDKTRQKAFNSVAVASYKDNTSGFKITELQKYQQEHPEEFAQNVGLLYALTNGFKDFNTFIAGKVKKEKKKGLQDLENVINSTSRGGDGLLKFAGNYAKEDPESFIDKGWKIDLS